jgi:hypothetical protein
LQGFPERVIDGSKGLPERTAKTIWGNAMWECAINYVSCFHSKTSSPPEVNNIGACSPL